MTTKRQLAAGVAVICAALAASPAPAVASDPIEGWPVLVPEDGTHAYESNSVTQFSFDFSEAGQGTYKGYIDCDGSMQGTVPHTGEEIYGWVSNEDAVVEFAGRPFENGTFVHTFEVPTGDNPYPYACWFIFETPMGERWLPMSIKQRQLDLANLTSRQRSVKFDLNNDARVEVIVKKAGSIVMRVGPVNRDMGTRFVKWNRHDVLRPGKYRLLVRGVDHWADGYGGASRDTARTTVRVR